MNTYWSLTLTAWSMASLMFLGALLLEPGMANPGAAFVIIAAGMTIFGALNRGQE